MLAALVFRRPNIRICEEDLESGGNGKVKRD
jgi:hypothetical protein